MATKNHIYLDEGRRNYKLNYSAIVQEFIDKKILDKSFSQKAGTPKFKDIFIFLNNNRDKFVDEEIILDIELDNEILNDSYSTARFLARYNLKELEGESSVESKERIQALKFIYLLMRNIDLAIDSTFSYRMMGSHKNIYEIKFDATLLQTFYFFAKNLIAGGEILNKEFRNNQLNFVDNGFDYFEINKKLNEIIKNKTIKIQINTKFFITKFLDKIDVFSDYKSEEEKNNIQFIDKFKDIRNQKDTLASKYYNYGFRALCALFVINFILYLFSYGKQETVDEFVKQFLGNGIFIFIMEILILTIGTYCFKLYNFYSKMVELYDSHIGLIESDLHYKNDEQIINGGDSALFELRKENTQKIHNLPDKALDLLNIKGDMKTSSDFSIKIIEKLIDKIK